MVLPTSNSYASISEIPGEQWIQLIHQSLDSAKELKSTAPWERSDWMLLKKSMKGANILISRKRDICSTT